MGKSSLQQRREQLGFTLRDVEQITEGAISNAHLSLIETGKVKNLSLKIAMTLAAVYATRVEIIAEWLGQEPPAPLPTCRTCGRPLFEEPRP